MYYDLGAYLMSAT